MPDLYLSLGIKVIIYGLYFLSLSTLLLGKAGYWAVGNLANFALGAFIYACGPLLLGISGGLLYLWIAFTVVAVTILALIPGFAALRLQGDFFAYVSICCVEVVRVLVEKVAGPSGFSHVPRPPGLESELAIILISAFLFIIVAVWIDMFCRTRLELMFATTRTSKTWAASMGIRVRRIEVSMFGIAGGLAGLSGVLFAIYSTGTDPVRFSLMEAVILFALAYLGGIKSIWAPLLSAGLYVITTYALESAFRGSLQIYAPYATSLFFGLILILAMAFTSEKSVAK